MSLSTCGADGAHAASLFYARDGLSLVWLSEARTRHSSELEADPRVAATIAPDTSDHRAIRGLQVQGTAECVAGEAERARLLKVLTARYPFLAELERAGGKMAEAMVKAGLYRLRPRRIVLIDNSLGFGHKETLVVQD